MKKVITLVLTLVAFAALGFSQTPTPVTTTSFSINLSPVTLPGGKSSIVGTESGIAFSLDTNFDIKEVNVIGSGFQYYGGGFNYRVPAISNFLANHFSNNLDGAKLQFYTTGSVGAISTPTGATSHWGETVGGGVNYNLNGTWALGAEIQYVKFPGYENNGFIVGVGPKISF